MARSKAAPDAGLDRSGGQPLHAQLAALLRSDVRARRLPVGTALPSEAALCERYGVARSVVRQALAALAAEGLIRREPGRPATVAQPREHRRLVQRSTGLYEQFAQSGVALRTRVLTLAPASAPPAAVAGFFGPGPLLMLERLRRVGERPFAYVRTWLPASRVAGLRAADLEDASLHRVLTQQFGLRPGAGRNQIRAVAADAGLSALLEVPAGSPLLRLEGQGRDQHGLPLEYFITWHRAEEMVFDVDVSDGRESVQARLDETAAPLPQAVAVSGPKPAPEAAAAGPAPMSATGAPAPLSFPTPPAPAPGGADPLARAQALLAELARELARAKQGG